MAYEYTGPDGEPARFSAEGGQSMPRVRKPATPTEVRCASLLRMARIDFSFNFNLRPSMKFTRSTISQFFRYGCTGHIGAAFASGNHAGGHGDGGDSHWQTRRRRQGQSHHHHRNERQHALHAVEHSGQTGRNRALRCQERRQVKHELSLGTEKELLEHLEQMKKFPDMEHDEPGKVTLAPGKQGEIVWQFTKAGAVNFACLMPGATMKPVA